MRATAVLIAAAVGAGALDVKENSVEGTRAEADGLSQKQLAMLRYFAYSTYMTEGDADPWQPWKVDGKIPSAAFSDLRYQVSDVAYGVAISAQRTPAYTEVHSKILKSAVARMKMNKVWDYIESFYPKDQTNGGSDPLTFKNIMYSGHLAQTMALYEAVSGDMVWTDNTFDFVNGGSKTTFNISGVMSAMYDQMDPPGGAPPTWATWYEGGGVPCEPVMIFLLCNNFPHNAFAVHDGIHGTHFKDSDKRWQATISQHVAKKLPSTLPDPAKQTSGDYFKVGFLIAARSWVPAAATPIAGGDAWALAWIRGWWDETDPDQKEQIYQGYQHLHNSKGWKVDAATNGTYHGGTPASFDFITTSFFPLIERQFYDPARKLETKSDAVMRYVEQFGQLIDTDGDGIKESYYYVKPKDAYRDASNGNLLAGMSLPNDGSAVDAVRDLFQASPPLFKKHAGEPRITHADYPAVMVPVARYDAAAKVLRFQLVAGDKAPEAATQVELANCQGFTSVTLDGKAFTDHTPGKAAGSLLIAAPPPTNTPQVWEVAFGA